MFQQRPRLIVGLGRRHNGHVHAFQLVDFRGVSTKSFDGRGNYTIGLHDQLIFPEIDYAKVDKLKGMNVTIVTTARSDDQARTLLKHLGMPFRA